MTDRDKSQEVRWFQGEYPLDGAGRCPQRVAWRPIPLGEGRYMQRVSGNDFFKLAVAVHPLTDLQVDTKVSSVVWGLHTARVWLDYFLSGAVIPLRVCRPNADRLVAAIDQVVPADFPATLPENWEEELGLHALTITHEVKEFETVLAAELQDTDTYFISKKGIYVTSDLIDAADMALDEDVRSVISPEAIVDFKESGKCLAFDLATAAGFHAMRATENVLRQYHALIVNPLAGTKCDWGQCIVELRKAGADTKTLGVVDQIRDLHRNPLMHPEAFLTVQDALRLFDIAKSAISAMADQIAQIPSMPPTSSVVP